MQENDAQSESWQEKEVEINLLLHHYPAKNSLTASFSRQKNVGEPKFSMKKFDKLQFKYFINRSPTA